MEIFEDAAAWRDWLERHAGSASEVWVVLAKKGTVEPTRLTYEEAVEEALCHGWIDGLTRSRDAATYLQRYTPRRPRSAWSRSNVDRVARLTAAGRMRPAGLAAVERARADGRWPV
ncbi:YdeI/OmpD-associated family protein [Nonomuraea bangladeshensis]|uniref:YdeI/OmpD-associated family protein n=1 Tax=Nonomuraea bangladeshensis TaxID=404385 RepID=UPI003C2F919F